MKKIANYRSGDRAEALGVVLMQMFSAVAVVPRQEDCGIVDAVATLLRRDDRLLYPEDSFSIQFKSRTEKKVEYLGQKFEALLNQELALFIARVDLTAEDIKLFSVASAMDHPNINNLKGLVLYLDPMNNRRENDVLHTSLGDPALHWTTSHLANEEFERKAYLVIKEWLDMDRWNRRYRKMGVTMQIRWKTNEEPSYGGKNIHFNPALKEQALGELVPAIQMIASHAVSDPALAESVLQLMTWMRDRGVEPDPLGSFSILLVTAAMRKRFDDVFETHDEAEFAIQLVAVRNTSTELDFWVHRARRTGSCSATRHNGTIDEIQALGFDVRFDPGSQEIPIVEPGPAWLKEKNCRIIGEVDGVFLLQKAEERSLE